MELIFGIIAGIAVGSLIGWLFGFKKGRENISELGDKFKSIASDALQGSNFKELVEKVNEDVESFKKEASDFEKGRQRQLGEMNAKIKEMLDTGREMSMSANTLETALSSSGAIKGDWGQKSLKNILDDAGLKEGIDYVEQKTIQGEGAMLRPDFVIKLPGNEGLSLAIDAKASLDDYLRAVKEEDMDFKKDHIKKFVDALRSRVKNLSNKEYQKYLDDKIPYVVMFIPSEAALRAAFDYDWDLFKEAQNSKVMLTSPTTTIPLILLIAHAWQQYKTTMHAEQLKKEFVDFSNRLRVFFSHIASVRLNLEQTNRSFNSAVGSYESKVLPKIEKINELGGDIAIDEGIKMIEEMPRMPQKLFHSPNSTKK